MGLWPLQPLWRTHHMGSELSATDNAGIFFLYFSLCSLHLCLSVTHRHHFHTFAAQKQTLTYTFLCTLHIWAHTRHFHKDVKIVNAELLECIHTQRRSMQFRVWSIYLQSVGDDVSCVCLTVIISTASCVLLAREGQINLYPLWKDYTTQNKQSFIADLAARKHKLLIKRPFTSDASQYE